MTKTKRRSWILNKIFPMKLETFNFSDKEQNTDDHALCLWCSSHTLTRNFCLFTLVVFLLQKIPPSFAGGICLYVLLCVCSLLSSWVIPVSWFNDYRLSKERMHFESFLKEWEGGRGLMGGFHCCPFTT